MSDYDLLRDVTSMATRLGRLERLETPLYQTGSWTPRVFGGSSAGTTTYTPTTGRQGIWTRHGRLVSCEAVVIWTAATGTGQLLIDGLPFPANNTSQLHVPVSLRTTGLGTAAIQAFVYFGTTQINLELVGGTVLAITGSGTINLQATYSL